MPATAINRFWLLIALALLLPACAQLQLVPDTQSPLAGTRISHALSWQDGDNTRNMLLVLEQQANSVQLVGLSNTGVTLFVLQRTAQGDTLQRTFFYDGKPDAKALLNQLLLVYYPPALIEQQLGEHWQLQVSATQRQWFYRGKLHGTAQFSEQNGQPQIQIQDTKQPLQLQVLATEQMN